MLEIIDIEHTGWPKTSHHTKYIALSEQCIYVFSCYCKQLILVVVYKIGLY